MDGHKATASIGAQGSEMVPEKVQTNDTHVRSQKACQNCGALLIGLHCHQCGQVAEIHRSISTFWHDILHGVLHFEGRFWNTLPLLIWHPGQLTRRYIQGERVKFISPMALFLFSVFMMFAVFSYVGKPNFIMEAFPETAEVSMENAKVGIYLDSKIDTGWIAFDNWLEKIIAKANGNPDLLLYKLQSNGYKFAWLLIPLSAPFVWLSTIGKRQNTFYDHIVFTTYSISSITLFFLLLLILWKVGVSTSLVFVAAVIFIPFHMYRQLKHAYGFSHISTMIRFSVLGLSATFAITLFIIILVPLGLIG